MRKLFNGPEAFTPDGEFILGESDVPGFWVAAGFCAHGLAGAGGMGWQVAEWIVNGEPSLDLWHMDIRRFGRQYRSQALHAGPGHRGLLDLLRHQVPQPRARRGPPAAALAGLRAAGRAGRGLRREVGLGARRTGSSRTRRRATRRCGRAAGPARTGRRRSTPRRWRRASGSGLFDESSFAKIEVHGPRRRRRSSSGCARNDVDRAVGLGHLHPDAELARRHRVRLHGHPPRRRPLPDRHRHRVRKPRPGLDPQARCPADGSVQVADVTSAYACLGLWGPRARDILQPLTKSDLSNDGLPLHDARASISIGNVPCLAVRVTYVGELGWELYCPTEYGAGALGRALGGRAREHGMLACGYRAIDALRVEKGYRVWGADITPEDDARRGRPRLRGEARQGRRVPRPRAPLAARPARRSPSGGSPAWLLADPRGGRARLRAGADRRRGRRPRHERRLRLRRRRSIAYAYVPAAAAEVGTAVEVEVFGEWVAAEVAAEPLWDPAGARIRA